MPEATNQTYLRKLGNTGLDVFPISLGCVKFGRNEAVRYPTSFQLPDLQSLAELLDVARELGVNLLDTAPAYGESETRIGQLLKQQPQHWLISTKVGEYFSNGVSAYDFSAEKTRQSVEASLVKLAVDYLDIVFVHSNGEDAHIVRQTPVLETLNQLKDAGLIRTIGFSGKTVEGSLLAMDAVDVFMVTLNPSDLSQIPLIETCKSRGKGVLIKKALVSGHSKDPAAALKFSLEQPGVSSVITGTINPDHLRQNVAVLSDAWA